MASREQSNEKPSDVMSFENALLCKIAVTILLMMWVHDQVKHLHGFTARNFRVSVTYTFGVLQCLQSSSSSCTPKVYEKLRTLLPRHLQQS